MIAPPADPGPQAVQPRRTAEVVGASVEDAGRGLRLRWSDGQAETLPAIWFLDNRDDAFDPRTGQRRGAVGELEAQAVIDDAALSADALTLHIAQLGELRLSRERIAARRLPRETRLPWPTPAGLVDLPPVRADAFLTQDEALGEALRRLVLLGWARLSGAGTTAGTLERLVARFGFIRETNYGRLFEVRAEPAASHLAYTDRALELHTDNPYRDPTPSVQLLHAIEPGEAGGDTRFVDGLAHAAAMAKEEPEAFARLTREAVDYRHADPDGAVYAARRPVIAVDPEGEPQAIHLNHRSLAPLSMAAERLDDWYAAYRAYCERVHRAEAGLVVNWRAGDVVMFDNRRILHGRDAFATGRSGRGRWLQGCYADMDGARATLARLSAQGLAS